MLSDAALQDLFAYLEDIHARHHELTVRKPITETEARLGDLASIMEEVGEFASAIRQREQMSYSRKKVEAATKDEIMLEGVDVLITTLLLLKKYHPGLLDEYVYLKIGKNQARGY